MFMTPMGMQQVHPQVQMFYQQRPNVMNQQPNGHNINMAQGLQPNQQVMQPQPVNPNANLQQTQPPTNASPQQNPQQQPPAPKPQGGVNPPQTNPNIRNPSLPNNEVPKIQNSLSQTSVTTPKLQASESKNKAAVFNVFEIFIINFKFTGRAACLFS